MALGERHGARLRFGERVTGWRRDGEGIELTTTAGTYTAERLVIAAGAWLPGLLPELELPLKVERQPLFWMAPIGEAELLGPDRLPIYIVELDDEHAFYGFPLLPGQGAKVARHRGGRPTDPDAVERTVDDADEAPVRRFLERYLPAANGRRLDALVCMYTNTPDYHFIVDRHPADERIVVCSACSGHGFKFSNVIGSIAADLVTTGTTEFEIDFLSLRRFAASARPV